MFVMPSCHISLARIESQIHGSIDGVEVLSELTINDLRLDFHLAGVGKRNRHGGSINAVFKDGVKCFHKVTQAGCC
jgi:hypothetical protein